MLSHAQVLDLFSLKGDGEQGREDKASAAEPSSGISSVLHALPELWNESEYAEEYDLSQYIANMKRDKVF